MSDTVKNFPVKCVKCKREIPDGSIYYHDKEIGFICEWCPGFERGGWTPEEETESEGENEK